MRSTAKLLAGCVAATLILWGSSAAAAPHPVVGGLLSGLSAPAQINRRSASEDRRKAEELLRRAREAMKQGNLELAESHIDRAAKLNVKYDSLFARFRDTPQKARRDLDKLKGRQSSSRVQPPSNRFAPSLLGNQPDNAPPVTTDPFAKRDAQQTLQKLTGGEKATAANYLRKGQVALDQGDTTSAISWYHKAKALKANFALGEYSPEKLADDLRRAGVAPRHFAATQHPAASPFVVRPSDAYNTAAERIPPVGGMRTSYDDNPFSQRVAKNPFQLESQRRDPFSGSGQSSRLQSGGSGTRTNNSLVMRSPLKSGQPSRLPNTTSRFSNGGPSRFSRGSSGPVNNSPSTQKNRGNTLLLDARRALARRNPAAAEKLLQQTRRLNVSYTVQDDSPEKVETLIQQFHSLSAASNRGESSPQFKQQYAEFLVKQAEGLLWHQHFDDAERVVREALDLKAPQSRFQRTPEQLLAQIAAERQRAGAGQGPIGQDSNRPDFRPSSHVAQASGSSTAGDVAKLGEARGKYSVTQSLYKPSKDKTRTVPATARQAARAERTSLSRRDRAGLDEGHRLFQQGEKALKQQDINTALSNFQAAWKHEEQLDEVTRDQLQNYLQQLHLSKAAPRQLGRPPLDLDTVEAGQQVLLKRWFTEVQHELDAVDRIRTVQPKAARQRITHLRQRLVQSDLDEIGRKQLLTRVERELSALDRYIQDNQAQIALDEENRQVLQDVDRDRKIKLEIQEKLAEMVDQYNRYLDEYQFAEAEILAKQARELDPQNPLVQNMVWKSRFIRRYFSGQAIREEAEEGFIDVMDSVGRSGIPFNDEIPYRFPDRPVWDDLTLSRIKLMRDQRRRLSPAEVEIKKALKKKVDVRFPNKPLGEVIQILSRATGINIYIDQNGLAQEAVTTDTPVTIDLAKPISLRSALNHILQPLRLNYLIQDEVLKITSEGVSDSDLVVETYNVADLVIPIPNFIPSYNMGLAGAMRQATHDALGNTVMGGPANHAPMGVFSSNKENGAAPNAAVLAQMSHSGMVPSSRSPTPVGFGPGGLGGGAQADFDPLIELITTTIDPTTWDEVGGAGSIKEFETNLSIVVSQTQEVHEKIADLLEQLRRLQDLQVTIEVRFITLADNFFERIGVDFDFDIDDNVTADITAPDFDDSGTSVTIGLDPTGFPTADLDLQFTQGGFSSAIPAFGGFDAGTAANFGFAILSDIEAFFVIQAAQGDQRTNVLQAPKVTLFNGQQSFVSDTTVTPFVTSVIPVVGDFAAAHQPVITVLTEGTSLSVQAVVSSDRRFVRLTVIPFFSKIGPVSTFTFTGRTSSTTSSSSSVDPDDATSDSNAAETVTEGTTVQLPSFSSVTVTTTVSVPDGGTVLLGGIKRLSEGRIERGVPLLSKIPYINRLFRNVGIGRESQSLMMMVTPRIIIQEEEEGKLLGN